MIKPTTFLRRNGSPGPQSEGAAILVRNIPHGCARLCTIVAIPNSAQTVWTDANHRGHLAGRGTSNCEPELETETLR